MGLATHLPKWVLGDAAEFLKAGVLSGAFGARRLEFQSHRCDLEQAALPLTAASEGGRRG